MLHFGKSSVGPSVPVPCTQDTTRRRKRWVVDRRHACWKPVNLWSCTSGTQLLLTSSSVSSMWQRRSVSAGLPEYEQFQQQRRVRVDMSWVTVKHDGKIQEQFFFTIYIYVYIHNNTIYVYMSFNVIVFFIIILFVIFPFLCYYFIFYFSSLTETCKGQSWKNLPLEKNSQVIKT